MNVLAFAGSLRSGSLNKKYIRAACRLLEPLPEVKVELIDLKDFPMPVYNQDIEDQAIPEPVLELAKHITNAQALVISTPEYNASISCVLKNTVDWLSRIKPNPLRDRHVLLLGASPGALGAVRGLWHSRRPFEELGCHVYPTMLGLPHADKAFNQKDELVDLRTMNNLNQLIRSFISHVGTHSSL